MLRKAAAAAMVVVVVFLLGACQSEPEVVYRDRPAPPPPSMIREPVPAISAGPLFPAQPSYQDQLEDQQQEALLDCLRTAANNPGGTTFSGIGGEDITIPNPSC